MPSSMVTTKNTSGGTVPSAFLHQQLDVTYSSRRQRSGACVEGDFAGQVGQPVKRNTCVADTGPPAWPDSGSKSVPPRNPRRNASWLEPGNGRKLTGQACAAGSPRAQPSHYP